MGVWTRDCACVQAIDGLDMMRTVSGYHCIGYLIVRRMDFISSPAVQSQQALSNDRNDDFPHKIPLGSSFHEPRGFQDNSDVPTCTTILADRCLLQDIGGGYRLHDLVLEYLQLTITMYGGDLAEKAASRQARYLGRLGVFNGYAARGQNVITGGLYCLIALWSSVSKLDEKVDAGACYAESLKGVTDMKTRRYIAKLLLLLVRLLAPLRIYIGSVLRVRGPAASTLLMIV